jgi:hypothetical protein
MRAHPKKSPMRSTPTDDCWTWQQTQRSTREKSSELAGAYTLINGKNWPIWHRLAAIGSKLRHDAFYDWIEDILWQLERIAFGNDLNCLEG